MAEHVDHPAHYGGADNAYEVIKVLEAWLAPDEYIGFLKGNSIKYLARHRQKGGDEDLRKADWYSSEMVRFIVARTANGGGGDSQLTPVQNGGAKSEN